MDILTVNIYAATNEPACLRSGRKEFEAVPLGGQAPAPSCLVPEVGLAESCPRAQPGPEAVLTVRTEVQDTG